MSTEQQPSNTPEKPVGHNPLNDPALERMEVPEVLDFLKENGMSILIGVGLAVVVFVGFSTYRNYRKSQEVTASAQLFNAQATEQIQQVVAQYPKTAVAPLAQLTLAGSYFDQGQFEMAQNAFATFIQQYPGHDLTLNAELGQLQCLEALGRYDEALDGYGRFIEANKGRYLEAAAVFGKGRCLEQLGRLPEARALYEDLLLADPKGRWAGRAEFSMQFVDKQMRAKEKGLPLEAAPAAANVPLNLPMLTPEAVAPPAQP